MLTELSNAKQVKRLILEFWSKPENSFTTTELLRFIRIRIGTDYIMPDTVLRYMRRLKADKAIDYACHNKKDMVYTKVNTD